MQQTSTLGELHPALSSVSLSLVRLEERAIAVQSSSVSQSSKACKHHARWWMLAASPGCYGSRREKQCCCHGCDEKMKEGHRMKGSHHVLYPSCLHLPRT